MLFENALELKVISISHYNFVSDVEVLIKHYSGALEASNSNIIPASLQTEHTTNKCIVSKAIEVNDCVKIINKPYKGFYAIVTCESYDSKWEIQYFKKTFDKYVLKEGDLIIENLKISSELSLVSTLEVDMHFQNEKLFY